MNLKDEIKEFKPVNMEYLNSANVLCTDAMKTSCALYNEALKHLSIGEWDTARAKLRQATKLYPEFGEAMILFGICTFANGDRPGTVKIFNSIKREADRTKAMKTLERLTSEDIDYTESGRINAPNVNYGAPTEDEIERHYKPDITNDGTREVSYSGLSDDSVPAGLTFDIRNATLDGSVAPDIKRTAVRRTVGDNLTSGIQRHADSLNADERKNQNDNDAYQLGEDKLTGMNKLLENKTFYAVLGIALAIWAIIMTICTVSLSNSLKNAKSTNDSYEAKATTVAQATIEPTDKPTA